MRSLVICGACLLFVLVTGNVPAQTMDGMHMDTLVPFVVKRSPVVQYSEADLDRLDKESSAAMIQKNGIVYVADGGRLVVRSGPSDDMLSYRIEGLRNPQVIVKPGATIHVIFANVDDDMHHDLRFGSAALPDTLGSVGARRLPPSSDEKFSAEEFTLTAIAAGNYKYFCSVRGHAAGGMQGVITVGYAPQMPAQGTIDSTMTATPSAGDMSSMPGMDMGSTKPSSHGMGSMQMNHPMAGILLTVPMAQEGSGTSWMPAATPTYMYMSHFNNWMLMLHGEIMPRFDHQGGPRGGDKFDAPNMEMFMLHHAVGTDGRFSFLLMTSLDPLTEGLKGYPLLLQTGESYHGQKLVDIQHPHDLIAEIAVAYSHRFGNDMGAFIYAGYPGEPALGPPVFMHRTSAMMNPDAPLSHHWMDATHIAFGVVTAGVSSGPWKLEGSYFNGREPDEFRYSFDKLMLNSYSGRLSFNPTDNWALQASIGSLKDPEGDGVDVIRSTASAIYTKKFGSEDWWSSTAAWGQNHDIGGAVLESFLIESEYRFSGWGVHSRAEYVEKNNAELNIVANPEAINPIKYLSIGLSRSLFSFSELDVDLGVQGSYYFVPSSLVSLYTEHPTSAEVYLSIHPSRSE